VTNPYDQRHSLQTLSDRVSAMSQDYSLTMFGHLRILLRLLAVGSRISGLLPAKGQSVTLSNGQPIEVDTIDVIFSLGDNPVPVIPHESCEPGGDHV
jgi:hypothetical protein